MAIVREQLLQAALNDVGVEMRLDSELCNAFVRENVGDLAYIVQKMCEGKFLHEYTNIDLGAAMARGIVTNFFGRAIPRQQWKDLIRQCALLTTKDRVFPEVWPWRQNVGPLEWKATNDMTHVYIFTTPTFKVKQRAIQEKEE